MCDNLIISVYSSQKSTNDCGGWEQDPLMPGEGITEQNMRAYMQSGERGGMEEIQKFYRLCIFRGIGKGKWRILVLRGQTRNS